MSRPPQTENTVTANRRGIIDFVSAPMNTAYYPADDAFMQAAYPVMGAHMGPPMGAPIGPAVYTMAAGYPTGPAQPSAYMQAPYPPPIPTSLPQGYVPAYAGSPYYTYPAPVLPDLTQRQLSAQTPVTEETLQQKVDSKIEAIMSAHKTDMLSQQISRLTGQVQKLSKNIEYQHWPTDRANSSEISATSDDPQENEMSRRLRKLAAESSRGASSNTGPKF